MQYLEFRDIRLALALTQVQMARLANVTVQMYRAVERGDRTFSENTERVLMWRLAEQFCDPDSRSLLAQSQTLVDQFTNRMLAQDWPTQSGAGFGVHQSLKSG